MATLAEIYDWFMTGKKPTQAQFWASWGSFWNKNESIPQSSISGLTSVLNAKVENDQFNAHKGANDAHAVLFQAKEDKTQKGAPNGYAPLDEFTKLAAQYLNIVNDLVAGGTTALLSAEQGKVLQTQVSAINTLLTSDNVNLDTVQELVDAIETVQLSLSTILVNDLTSGGITKALTAEMGKLLQTNKVDKVAGERLINAAEITKLAGLSNVVTTVKTILSTALATQDIAGFVTYINTLAAPLVVGANEIVEYKTSDTGRVFKLLLRGRSFGVGQPAIVAADILEVTEFLNKDIKLSNYPSSRNDGQLPTNKVLAPDVNGNLKLYTIATAPAPYMEVLIPESTLPSTTTNFTIKGAFFTPTMTVSIVGQTVNYLTFVSDNLIKVNVTTGAAEGMFAVTLNNGLSSTYSNALLIVVGTVYTPNLSEWTNLISTPDISTEGRISNLNSSTVQGADWKIIPAGQNFRIMMTAQRSGFTSAYDPLYFQGNLQLIGVADGLLKLNSAFRCWVPNQSNGGNARTWMYSPDENSGDSIGTIAYGDPFGKTITIERIGTTIKYYVNGTLIKTFTGTINVDVKIRFKIINQDISNIKYITIA